MLTSKRIRSFRPGTAAKLPDAAGRLRPPAPAPLGPLQLFVKHRTDCRRIETIGTTRARTSPARPKGRAARTDGSGQQTSTDRQLPCPAASRGWSGFAVLAVADKYSLAAALAALVTVGNEKEPLPTRNPVPKQTTTQLHAATLSRRKPPIREPPRTTTATVAR
jgi:hypothetical protein